MNKSGHRGDLVAARRLGLLAQAPVHASDKGSPIFVAMGVSGSGKSAVGAQLAVAQGPESLEGDTLHSATSVARMAAGVALSDADRAGWLQTLAERIRAARMAGRTGHYMPLSLLVSQLATLEVPDPQENAQIFDVASRPEAIVAAAVAGFSLAK